MSKALGSTSSVGKKGSGVGAKGPYIVGSKKQGRNVKHTPHSAKPCLGALPRTDDTDSRSLARKLLLSALFWMRSKKKPQHIGGE